MPELDYYPGYEPRKKNRLVVVLADHCFAGTSSPVDEDPTKAKAEAFMQGLVKFCQQNKFEIEGFGTKETMAARLNKRNGKELLTTDEAIEYANFCIAFAKPLQESNVEIISFPSPQEWMESIHKKPVE